MQEPICYSLDLDFMVQPHDHDELPLAALLLPGDESSWYSSRPLVAIEAEPHFPLHAFELEPVPCHETHQVTEPASLVSGILVLLGWWIKNRWL